MSPDERPALSLSAAAEACRVSRATIRRRLDDGAFPNAYRDEGPAGPETGPWRVPITDLIAADLHPNAPGVPDTASAKAVSAPTDTPDDEVVRLRAEVVAQRHRAELAEAIAAERARALEDLRTALRALPAAPAAPAPEPAAPTDPERPWWRRMFSL
jgi:hypothetical protein